MVVRLVVLLAALLGLARAGTNDQGLKFLEENKGKEGVITLASGMQYKVLRKGSGAFHPTKDSPCECHYEGTLINGDEFDSSCEPLRCCWCFAPSSNPPHTDTHTHTDSRSTAQHSPRVHDVLSGGRGSSEPWLLGRVCRSEWCGQGKQPCMRACVRACVLYTHKH